MSIIKQSILVFGAGMTVSVAAEEYLDVMAQSKNVNAHETLKFDQNETDHESSSAAHSTDLIVTGSASADAREHSLTEVFNPDYISPQCPTLWAGTDMQPEDPPHHRPNWYKTCAFKEGPKQDSYFYMTCNDGSVHQIAGRDQILEAASAEGANADDWNWGVCNTNKHGGRMICPGISPYMCAQPNNPDCSDDYCCEQEEYHCTGVHDAEQRETYYALVVCESDDYGDTECFVVWGSLMVNYPPIYIDNGGLRKCEWALCNATECLDSDEKVHLELSGVSDTVGFPYVIEGVLANDCDCFSNEYDYGYLTCLNEEEIRISCDHNGHFCTTPINPDCTHDCEWFDSSEIPTYNRNGVDVSMIWSFCNYRGKRASCPYSSKEMCGNPNSASPDWGYNVETLQWEPVSDDYGDIIMHDFACEWQCGVEDGGKRKCPVYHVPRWNTLSNDEISCVEIQGGEERFQYDDGDCEYGFGWTLADIVDLD